MKSLPLFFFFFFFSTWNSGKSQRGTRQKKNALRLETLLNGRKVAKVEPRGCRIRLSAVKDAEPEVDPLIRGNPRVAADAVETSRPVFSKVLLAP